MDEQKSANDEEIESHGVPIIYNSGLKEYIGNLTIDYDNSMPQRGFIIKDSKPFRC
ncbi:MAG TPA: hypothetical protein GXX46_01870 [Peptococcaceae bacterium]|nr:hypothetical protein [Peptococcaceae bacterium]